MRRGREIHGKVMKGQEERFLWLRLWCEVNRGRSFYLANVIRDNSYGPTDSHEPTLAS